MMEVLKPETKRRDAAEKMAAWANEAQRLHDAGDLKGAHKALKEAERCRVKMEAVAGKKRE